MRGNRKGQNLDTGNEELKHSPTERARKTMWGSRSGSSPIGLEAEKQRGEFWILKGKIPKCIGSYPLWLTQHQKQQNANFAKTTR